MSIAYTVLSSVTKYTAPLPAPGLAWNLSPAANFHSGPRAAPSPWYSASPDGGAVRPGVIVPGLELTATAATVPPTAATPANAARPTIRPRRLVPRSGRNGW